MRIILSMSSRGLDPSGRLQNAIHRVGNCRHAAVLRGIFCQVSSDVVGDECRVSTTKHEGDIVPVLHCGLQATEDSMRKALHAWITNALADSASDGAVESVRHWMQDGVAIKGKLRDPDGFTDEAELHDVLIDRWAAEKAGRIKLHPGKEP